MIKRLSSLALALLLCTGLAAPAWAAEDPFQITWLPVSGDCFPIEYNRDLNWLTVDDDDGYTVIDLTTNAQIEDYDIVYPFSEGLAWVMKKDTDGNKKYGFIDKTGRLVAPLEYDGAEDFSEGLARVMKKDADGNRKYGYIDKTGKVVVPLEYDYAGSFSEGLAWVEKGFYPNEKRGYIDKTGAVVVPLEYDGAASFSEGLAWVQKRDADGKWKYGCIDKTGKLVIPLEYDEVPLLEEFGRDIEYCDDYYTFSDGLAAVAKEDADGNMKFGYVDKTGKVVVPLEYDRPNSFSEGLARVAKKDAFGSYKYGFVDRTGKVVIPLEYAAANNFSDGLALVRRGSQRCYIDKTGEVIIIPEYNAYDFSEGLAPVEKWDADGKRKYGYIDKTGAVVIPLEYDSAGAFSDGFACVGKSGERLGLIDKTGAVVLPLEYYGVGVGFWDGLKNLGKRDDDGNMKYGYFDKTGAVVVPVEYDRVAHINDTELCWVQKGDRYGVFTNPYWTPEGPAADSKDTAGQPAGGQPVPTAYSSTQSVLVDGKAVDFYAYALKDTNGNLTNYVKLRDVAAILNGSAAQFEVGWDGSITINTKTAYTPNGSENIANFSGNQSYTVNTSPVKVNGVDAALEAITLTDESGGGYTYFKLRDLGAALGFDVSWDATNGISIDTTRPYTPD